MKREEAIRIATGLRTDFKCESDTMVDFCNTIIKALEQQPCCNCIEFKRYAKEMGFEIEQEPCEDCISRQAVLEQTYSWCKDEFLRTTNPFDYLRKRINSLPPVTPTSSKMEQVEWISVKDKMPKDGEWVLCQLDDEFYDENTMMVLYHTDDWGEKWVDGGLGTGSYDVCAWMPLPKPYVKEVKE